MQKQVRQLPEGAEGKGMAFLAVSLYFYSCNNPMFTIYGNFHEVSHTSFAPVMDIATLRIDLFCLL